MRHGKMGRHGDTARVTGMGTCLFFSLLVVVGSSVTALEPGPRRNAVGPGRYIHGYISWGPARPPRAGARPVSGVRGVHRAGGRGVTMRLRWFYAAPPPRAAACATCFRELGEMPRHASKSSKTTPRTRSTRVRNKSEKKGERITASSRAAIPMAMRIWRARIASRRNDDLYVFAR